MEHMRWFMLHVSNGCSRIEETWRLWQKFLDDFARFDERLVTSEETAALPNSSGVLYTVAKEELKKFEVKLLQLFYFIIQHNYIFSTNMHTNVWRKVTCQVALV